MTRIVDTLRPRFGVGPVCREIGVATSSYYRRKVRERDPSARAREDVVLTAQIITARTGRRAGYGQKRTWLELADRGIDVGRDRVARLMRANGLAGVRRGRRHVTTIPDGSVSERPADLVERDFTATGPNRLWVADFTYLRTTGGFVYLAFILDAYSRMIVGWQLASHRRATLVTDALEMGICLRDPEPGLVAHTDAGSQYTSIAYTDRVADAGMLPSIGTVGDALDNALAESWVATIKAELVQGRIFASVEQAEHEVLAWISFYNHQRLHASLGYLSPTRREAGERGHGGPSGRAGPSRQLYLGALAGPGGNNQ